MSLLESDLKFYYLVDSGETFDDEEMNENSITIELRPSSSSAQPIIELKHPYLTAPKSLSIGKLKKHIFRKLTRKMAKLAKTILKSGIAESYGISEQYAPENKQHLIDALSLLDDPTQIRVFISASNSTPLIQLDDAQKLDTIHQDVRISLTIPKLAFPDFIKSPEINKFSHLLLLYGN